MIRSCGYNTTIAGMRHYISPLHLAFKQITSSLAGSNDNNRATPRPTCRTHRRVTVNRSHALKVTSIVH